MRINQQPAYVLLNRPYTESSWVVEIFSRDHGRMALMAKGARRLKSPLKGVLLPFQPLLLSWSGKGEVPTVTSAEIQSSRLNLIDHELEDDALVCGFYCNELLMYLLHRHDPHEKLFEQYHSTIMQLTDPQRRGSDTTLAAKLRDFERMIIREIGYEVSFSLEAGGKTTIDADAHYLLQQGQGFVRCVADARNAVPGRVILAMQSDAINLHSEADISQSKHLMRDILSHSLGYKKIVSRELFFPRTR